MSLGEVVVAGILCDITGVLYESSSAGDGLPVPGSIQAIEELKKANIPIRFVTNESQSTRSHLHHKLLRLGYSMAEEDILPPALAARHIMLQQNLRPYLLVHERVLPDFEGLDTENPNCVVLGDAVDEFSYQNLNKAFRLIKENDCKLLSLGKGKYYREDDHLTLDCGPFTAALEFATGQEAVVCGKPDPAFFQAGLSCLALPASQVVMVGDDVVSDVGGAQKCGIRGVLVRSGKFTPADLNHPEVTPHLVVDNLQQLVSLVLQQHQQH